MGAETDNRRHERVQYFLVPQDHAVLPVWVFKPDAARVGAVAGLVLDVAAGGIQILSCVSDELDSASYSLTLISGEPDTPTDWHAGAVRRIWFRPEGLYLRNGFAFRDEHNDGPMLLQRLLTSEHHMLRCTLEPLN